ncbi:hypothetical protein PQQ96_41500 [Paraburkholderia sediminicola]|uniref:hypothetical protein n=1 Tax=Paraburkholderia sediminicola TaxID=458836 RepID=UPI0038BC2720
MITSNPDQKSLPSISLQDIVVNADGSLTIKNDKLTAAIKNAQAVDKQALKPLDTTINIMCCSVPISL